MPEPTESTPALPDDIKNMSPAQARSEIDRVRADSTHAWQREGHPHHADAVVRMEHLYRRIAPPDDGMPAPKSAPDTPTPVPPAEAAPSADPGQEPEPATETVIAADLPPGYEWHEESLNAIGALADQEGIDPAFLREGPALVARLLTERFTPLSGEEAEDVLEREFGRSFEHNMAGAAEVWGRLQPKVQQDLERVGLKTHPEFVKFLVRVHEHMWDPMTDRGLLRIKERGLAALAAEAKQAPR